MIEGEVEQFAFRRTGAGDMQDMQSWCHFGWLSSPNEVRVKNDRAWLTGHHRFGSA